VNPYRTFPGICLPVRTTAKLLPKKSLERANILRRNAIVHFRSIASVRARSATPLQYILRYILPPTTARRMRQYRRSSERALPERKGPCP